MDKFFTGWGGYRLFNLQGVLIPATGTVELAGVYDAAKKLAPDTPVLVHGFLVEGGAGKLYGGIASVIHTANDTEVKLGLAGYKKQLLIDSTDKISWITAA